jgi:hypothetical protein
MTAATVLTYVRKNPGATCHAVATHFGVSCLEAGSLLRALRAAGDVRSKGRTRGVKYTAR